MAIIKPWWWMGSSICIYDLQDDPETNDPQSNWNLIATLFRWRSADRSHRDMTFNRFKDLLKLVLKYLICWLKENSLSNITQGYLVSFKTGKYISDIILELGLGDIFNFLRHSRKNISMEFVFYDRLQTKKLSTYKEQFISFWKDLTILLNFMPNNVTDKMLSCAIHW